MASRAKNKGGGPTSEELVDQLDDLQRRIERCKVMFEQYFLGIQKTAPMQMHRDLERAVRRLTQLQIRNTGLRFRFTTLAQKFASYNTYWKRTLREIERGTYIRDMARVGRDAVRSGKDIPEELLAKMPKRMRERILKERDAAIVKQRQRQEKEAALRNSGKVREVRPANVHSLSEDDLMDDVDLDSIFSEMTGGFGESSSQPPSTSGASGFGLTSDSEVDDLFAGVISEAPSTAVSAATKPKPRPKPAPRQAAKPSVPPPIPKAARKPAERPPPGMSEKDAKALFQRYKKARQLVGDDTSKLSYNKLMRSLNKQAPKIMESHKAKGVKFDVAVKGDKVVIKAKPKKE